MTSQTITPVTTILDTNGGPTMLCDACIPSLVAVAIGKSYSLSEFKTSRWARTDAWRAYMKVLQSQIRTVRTQVLADLCQHCDMESKEYGLFAQQLYKTLNEACDRLVVRILPHGIKPMLNEDDFSWAMANYYKARVLAKMKDGSNDFTTRTYLREVFFEESLTDYEPYGSKGALYIDSECWRQVRPKDTSPFASEQDPNVYIYLTCVRPVENLIERVVELFGGVLFRTITMKPATATSTIAPTIPRASTTSTSITTAATQH
jgi:hypothetical protein